MTVNNQLSTADAPQAERPDPQGPDGPIGRNAYRALVIVLLLALLVVGIQTLGATEEARHAAACAEWRAAQPPDPYSGPGWSWGCPKDQ